MLSCYLLLLIISKTMGYIDSQTNKYLNPLDDDFNKPHEPEIGPKGMPYNKTTTCETFRKFARFNPHSIVGIKWFMFYYWAPHQRTLLYKFWIPTKKDIEMLHSLLDGHLPKHFNWSSTLVFRKELITKDMKLLEQKGDRGEYMMYHLYKGLPTNQMTYFKKLVIRQTGDNKYLGIMDCAAHQAKIFSRFDAIPPQNKLQEEASKLGYIGRKGKSYLYQGNEWMPVPETDELEFWFRNRGLKSLR